MRKKSILLIIILFVICCYQTVGAADSYGKKASLAGTISFNNKRNIPTGNANLGDYHYYDYTFQADGGGVYTAYCISPDFSGKSGNHLTCQPLSASQFPATYYLLANPPAAGAGEDAALVKNVAFREAGILDNQLTNGVQTVANKMFKAFTVTTQLNSALASTVSAADKANYDMSANPSIRSGILAAVNAELTSTGGGGTPTTTTPTTGGNVIQVTAAGGVGSLVKITPIPTEEKSTGLTPLSKKYKIESVTGGVINDLSVTGDDKLSVVLQGWNGTSGTIVVTPKSINDCVGTIVVQGAGATSAPTSGSTAYLCGRGSIATQQYVVFGPGISGDIFEITDLCECDENHPKYNPDTKTCDNDKCPDCNDVVASSSETPVQVEIENCCGGHNKISQEYLNKLFCKDTTLGVDTYKPKCVADGYSKQAEDITGIKNGDEICSIYCADSLEYGLPDTSEGMLGRGFELRLIDLDPAYDDGVNKFTQINGPWLKEWARCRVTIKFDDYLKKYDNYVKDEAKYYNEAEQASANYKYLEAIDNNKTVESHSYSFKIKGTKTTKWAECVTRDALGNELSRDYDCTASTEGTSGTYSGTVEIYKYPVANKNDFKFTTVKQTADNKTTNKVENAGTGLPTIPSRVYYEESQVNQYLNAAASDWDGQGDSRNYDIGISDPSCPTTECYYGSTDSYYEQIDVSVDASIKNLSSDSLINMSVQKGSYSVQYGKARSKYGGAKGGIEDLQKNLTKCDNAMREAAEPGSPRDYNNKAVNVNNNIRDTLDIDINKKNDKVPTLEFSYVQAFLDDEGKFQDQLLSDMNFERYCTINWTSGYAKNGADAEGTDADKYSTLFGTGFMNNTTLDVDLSNDPSSGLKSSIGSNEYVNYNADKVFVTDGLAEIYCVWDNQKTDTRYTLVPSGVLVDQDGYEFKSEAGPIVKRETQRYQVEHEDRWRYVVSTQLTGTFETYFKFSRVGIFNDYTDLIEQQSPSCSGSLLGPSCTFTYNADSSDAGGCDPLVTISKNDNICDKFDSVCHTDNFKKDGDECYGQVIEFFDYKLADPNNLFPNGYSDNYAYNWQYTDEGTDVKKTVEEDAKKDKTYSPDNLTYSFTLTSNDLRAIKDFNNEENKNDKNGYNKGGYMDFNMTCDPNESIIKSGNYYKRCYSEFIKAISGGSMKYGNNNSKTLSLKTNNVDLATARHKVVWRD